MKSQGETMRINCSAHYLAPIEDYIALNIDIDDLVNSYLKEDKKLEPEEFIYQYLDEVYISSSDFYDNLTDSDAFIDDFFAEYDFDSYDMEDLINRVEERLKEIEEEVEENS